MPTAVNEQIKILVELQKIDSEIYRTRRELASIPEQQKKIEQDFEKNKAGFQASEAALKILQMKQKEKEGELQSKEEKIKKLQSQLYQLKSNKEYSTMEFEIKALKADDSLLEEEIIGFLDQVEQAKSAIAKEKEVLAGHDKKTKEELEVLKKRAVELEAHMRNDEDERKKYLPTIEPKLLAQYEKILKNREGLAIVPVRNQSCGGCHIGLPPQVVNEIHLQDKLIVCEECARILYWAS